MAPPPAGHKKCRTKPLLTVFAVALLLPGTLLVAGSIQQIVQGRLSLDKLRATVASIPVSREAPDILQPSQELLGLEVLALRARRPTTASALESEAKAQAVREAVLTIDSIAKARLPVDGSESAPESETLPSPPRLASRVAESLSPSATTPGQATAASVIQVNTGKEIMSFWPVNPSTLPGIGSLPPATRIQIPAIDVELPIVPLEPVNHKGQIVYRNPVREVGRLPGTGNPGEVARGWYFGHNYSIYLRYLYGPAFFHLPEIVDLLADGETVDVILETPGAAYLYRVIDRPVILTAEEFHNGYFQANLFAPVAEIVLITCVPPPMWDYRLLITARLIGVGPLPE